ncbi:MAG: preprotein translocase subunit SecG [Solirubrobacterales bacterium]
MSLSIVLTVCQVIVSIILIVVVLMQPGKTNGFSGIMSSGGASESFYSKNKSRTSEARLIRITIVCAIIFAGLSLAQNFIGK